MTVYVPRNEKIIGLEMRDDLDPFGPVDSEEVRIEIIRRVNEYKKVSVWDRVAKECQDAQKRKERLEYLALTIYCLVVLALCWIGSKL